MDAIFKFLGDNNVLFSYIFGILGIVTGFIFYIKSKKKPRLRYHARGVTIFDSSDKLVTSDMKVIIDGKQIDYLLVNLIVIYNSGNTVINKNDFAANDKLRIGTIDNIDLYKVDILHPPKTTHNDFKLVYDEGKYHLDFDYFDKNEGCIIRVFSNAPKSKDIIVEGTLKGYGKLKSNSEIEQSESWFWGKIFTPRLQVIALELLSFLIACVGLVYMFLLIANLNDPIKLAHNISSLLIITFIGISVGALGTGIKRKIRLPKNLDNIFKNF